MSLEPLPTPQSLIHAPEGLAGSLVGWYAIPWPWAGSLVGWCPVPSPWQGTWWDGAPSPCLGLGASQGEQLLCVMPGASWRRHCVPPASPRRTGLVTRAWLPEDSGGGMARAASQASSACLSPEASPVQSNGSQDSSPGGPAGLRREKGNRNPSLFSLCQPGF